MNPRTIIFAVIAIAIAGGTGLLVKNWMAAQRSAMMAGMPKDKGPPKTDQILVAKSDIPAGTFIKRELMDWQAWPQAKVNPAYLQNGKRKKSDIVGSVARFGIAAGEPITEGRIVKPGQRGFLAAVLSPGMRAMSVAINATSGIAGFVFPGDRVDILLSHRLTLGGEANRRVSETILENARVIAVDQNTGSKNPKAKVGRTATLELTPKQVELVTVARSVGKLSMSLRSLRKEDFAYDTPVIVDPNQPVPSDPAVRGKTYTRESEVSRLLGGGLDDGQTHVMTVIRGKKSEVTRLRSITK